MLNKLNAGCDAPTRQSQVQAGLDSVSKEIEMLKDAIGSLEQRLSPVLQMSPPVATAEKRQSLDAMCPVASRLNGMVKQVHAMRDAVNDIMQRCEC